MKEYVYALQERRQKPVATNVSIARAGAIVLLKDEVKHKARLRVGKIID